MSYDMQDQTSGDGESKQAHREIELYSAVGGSPRIFKLEGMDAFGIELGGKVCIKPLSEWHCLGWTDKPDRLPSTTPQLGEAK